MNENGGRKVQGDQVMADEAELRRLIPPDRRDHCFLLGFYSDQESRQFLQGKNLQQEHFDELVKRCDAARVRITTLLPLSGEPEVRPILEPEVLLEIAKVTERPDFKQVFPEGTWSISLVELSLIVPFQPNVDIAYADKQGEESLNPRNLLSAVRLCFPYGKPTTLAINFDQAQKAITVSGINPSLQVVGFNWGQQDTQGPFVVSMYINAGPNIVQVSRYRGRYFLSNGYHRVYRLMKAGFTHIPCLLKNASNLAETGALAPGFFSESVLMAPRPPLFPDFGDEVLGITVPIHGTKKVVRIRPDEFLMAG
jgi:hypothetical protein